MGPAIRYTLRRNTANVMKIWFLFLQDEIIKVTLPTHLIQTDGSVLDERNENEAGEALFVDKEWSTAEEKSPLSEDDQSVSTSSGLIPPPGLFKNQRFHKMQIFVNIIWCLLRKLVVFKLKWCSSFLTDCSLTVANYSLNCSYQNKITVKPLQPVSLLSAPPVLSNFKDNFIPLEEPTTAKQAVVVFFNFLQWFYSYHYDTKCATGLYCFA